MNKLIIISLLFSSLANAQETEKKEEEKKVEVSVGAGTAGGSFYDVPRVFPEFDKYGKERLSPTGYYFTGTLASDQFGNLYFRQINVSGKEIGAKLGTQEILKYESPKLLLKEKNQLNLFIKGDLIHYAQKDHFIYFKADGENTPELDKNLGLQDHYRIDQQQTYALPMIGICLDKNLVKNDFKFEGFAELALAPIGYLNYSNQITDNKLTTGLPTLKNAKGNTLATGAELILKGVIKYKDRYYFQLHLEQNVLAGMNKERSLASNRTTSYELGYDLNKNVNFNVHVENNELILLNADRRAIDVFNTVGAGVKYTIPYRK